MLSSGSSSPTSSYHPSSSCSTSSAMSAASNASSTGSSNSECSSFFTTDLRTTFVGIARISALVLPFFFGAVLLGAAFLAVLVVFVTAFFAVFFGFSIGSPPMVCASGSFTVFFATFILSYCVSYTTSWFYDPFQHDMRDTSAHNSRGYLQCHAVGTLALYPNQT